MESKNWPLIKLNEEKEAFVQQVILESINELKKIASKKDSSLIDVLEKTVYKEIFRTIHTPWAVDPKKEDRKWSKYKQRLSQITALESDEEKTDRELELLREIVDGYAREITGKFNLSSYKFSVAVVPVMFSWLLSRAMNGIKGFFTNQKKVSDKVQLKGSIDQVKKLADKGTIVLVPTHFSNLDSILIGYGVFLAKLPPFLYGAGLNLFNNRIIGYFINRLGAYKVDRRKKNAPYLETLKAFSRIAIERGTHSLFFPGGTRSRSGSMEDKLKLGLLGTVVEAQAKNFINKENQKKIFVVPVVIGYHFVLEAQGLVKQHLKQKGKEKVYLQKEQFGSFFQVLGFIWNFFSKGSEIKLSFGRPMDVLGNYVNKHGESISSNGRIIDVTKYFVSDGKLKLLKQRDSQYTQILADKIVESYKKENIVLSSHIVSFLAFELIKKRYEAFDLYNMLRLTENDTAIEYLFFYKKISEFQQVLIEHEKNGKLRLDPICEEGIEELIQDGIKNVGIYHTKKVLFVDSLGRINTKDMNLLYFYHNRLLGYSFEDKI